MSLWRKLKYLASPSARRAEDRDIEDEIESLRQFAGPGELGNTTVAAEDARGALSWLWLEHLWQDTRYALRSMLHARAFTALVVVSLALGIGANTAIYSFLDAVLLRPLPVRDPHSLVVMKWRAKDYTLASSGMMWSTGGSTHDTAGTFATIFPYPALQVFRDSHDVLSSAFSYFSTSRLSLTVRDETESVSGVYVSGEYFAGIGAGPIAGRWIQPADDDPSRAAVVVLSERFSRSRFGDPQSAVGQIVRINDKPFSVLGVAPAAFFGAEPGSIPDVYLPMHADAVLQSAIVAERYADHHLYWIEVMGRLKDGVTVAQAQAALAPKFRRYVESTATTEAQKADLPALIVEPGATGLDTMRRQFAQPIYVLMAMVGLILLTACANIASLQLSRAVARRREIAVRLSIGASRSRVIRQLLTESVLLSLMGGVAGIAVAWWGIDVLTTLLSNGRQNFTLHAGLNWSVLAVTMTLSVAAGLLFGLAPALQATRVDVAPALKEVRANAAPRRRFGPSLGQALVVLQVVLSLVLLVGAGLFGRTLANLHAIPTGFDRDNLLLFSIRPSTVGYQGPALLQLYDRIRHDVAQLPGVQRVSLSSAPLPMGGGTMAPVTIVGASPVVKSANGRPPAAVIENVGPDFFSTMRIRLMGRDFNEQDIAGAPAVVIVNRRLGRLFGVEEPVGRAMTFGTTEYQIVGVVDDALAFTLKEELRPAVYFPYMQSVTAGTKATRQFGQMSYEVRTAGAPLAVAPAIRRIVRLADSRLAVSDVKTEAAYIDEAISTEITLSRLCTAFAALALLIACVGVYGTVAFNVSRRTNEIGIRMTLGARRAGIVWMIVRQVVVMTLAGLAIGVPLALLASGSVRTLLYGVAPTDPVAIAMGVGALLICGMAAGLIPAGRAARIDPMSAIRHE